MPDVFLVSKLVSKHRVKEEKRPKVIEIRKDMCYLSFH